MALASAMNMAGVAASRPAAAIAGRFYFATDTLVLSYDNGSAWTTVPAAAGELGYTQITTASLTTASTTAVDLTGVTVTATILSRPVLVSVYIPQWSHTANNAVCVFLIYDVTASAIVQLAVVAANGTGNANAIAFSTRVNPAAGSRTYKVQFYTITTGTITVVSGATQPTSIQVVSL